MTDPELESSGLLYASFTLILGGVACPRVGNPRLTPPTPSEPFGVEARDFVEVRLLQRELKITLHGTDKSKVCLVGTVHHPRGNIGAEILKNGLGRISDWTIRMMSPGDIPPLRIAENAAKVSSDLNITLIIASPPERMNSALIIASSPLFNIKT